MWVTNDEGETYTQHNVPFVPDKLVFQSPSSPAANESSQSDLVLGYEVATRAVSKLAPIAGCGHGCGLLVVVGLQ